MSNCARERKKITNGLETDEQGSILGSIHSQIIRLGTRLQMGQKNFHIWLRVPKNGPNNAKKQGVRQINLKKRTKFYMMVGFFFPNHRIDMQVGVGLHMSHARQNLGTLGGFKTPLH